MLLASLAQFGLITLILVIVMLPRVLAIHYTSKKNSKSEKYEFDYR